MKKCLYIISLLSLLSSCYNEDDYQPDNIEPERLILDIRSEKEYLLANGTDVTKITVELPGEIREEYSTIKLKTTNGTFKETDKIEAEVSAKVTYENGVKKRIGTALLQSSLSANAAKVQVIVNNVSKTQEIPFKRNYAEQLTVMPSALFMNSGYAGELTVKVLLSSPNGKVTPGQVVDLKIIDNLGNAKGSFRLKESESNSSGECNFIYSLIPDTTFTGELSVIANAVTDSKTIRGSTKISVIKK